MSTVQSDLIGFPAEAERHACSESALERGQDDPRSRWSCEVEPDFDLNLLPPMPRPAYFEMATQSLTGCLVVCAVTAMFLGTTYAVPLATDRLPPSLWWICFLLMHGEAAVAFVSLLGLLFASPGVIRRSPATCLPIPSEVAQRIKLNRSTAGMANMVHGDRIYCVRCLVWRPSDAGKVHHCNTCQRCVVEFDHHCGVFGRCIAGPNPCTRP